MEFEKVKSETCGKKRVRKGSLDSIIEEAREKFNLPMEVKLNKKNIRSCFKPAHKNFVAHRGTSSPMVKVEALFFEMLLLMADMQAPVMCREGLELANSLVRGTAMEGEIKEWKKRHLPHQQSDDEDNDDSMLLGQKYWNNFCSRHSNQLSTK